MRTRSFIFADAFTLASVALQPRRPTCCRRTTIIRTFRLSSDVAEARRGRPAELEQALRVAVEIDRGILRLRHHVRGRDQRRFRPIVEDARRRKLGRHAAARTDFGRAGRTLLAGLNRRRVSASASAAGTAAASLRDRALSERACGKNYEKGGDRPAAHEDSGGT